MVTAFCCPTRTTYWMNLFKDVSDANLVNISSCGKSNITGTRIGYLILIYLIAGIGIWTIGVIIFNYRRGIGNSRRRMIGTNVHPILFAIGVQVRNSQCSFSEGIEIIAHIVRHVVLDYVNTIEERAKTIIIHPNRTQSFNTVT